MQALLDRIENLEQQIQHLIPNHHTL
jgi:hypothetical protein